VPVEYVSTRRLDAAFCMILDIRNHVPRRVVDFHVIPVFGASLARDAR